MKMPAFTAEAALYQTRANYQVAATGATQTTQIVPQQFLIPAGLCSKACRLCNPRFPWSNWCRICDRCFDF